MSFLEKYLGRQKLSIVNDPFKVSKVTSVYVRYSESVFGGNWGANGDVEFKNGNTEGRQKFEGETFDEVVVQIKAFIQTLDKS